MNSIAALRALMEAKSIRLVDDHVASPPAKSETPLKTITGTPGDMAVCLTKIEMHDITDVNKLFYLIKYIIYSMIEECVVSINGNSGRSRRHSRYVFSCGLLYLISY